VTVRMIRPLAAAFGVWVGGIGLAAEPVRSVTSLPPTSNQQLADAIANRLTSLAVAQGADISMNTQEGVVTLTGFARDLAQKNTILDEVRVIPGVKLVRDGIKVMNAGLEQVQAVGDAPSALPALGPVAQPMTQAAPPSGAVPNPAEGNPVVEPTPLGAVPGVMAGTAPPLPPYAWPTYAPYNNYSRVAYPQAYPYNAFPFIGPFYPFPKVPLGWRSVKLEWEDGHWWLGKTSAPHDYWRVRFW
jgi:hypothetical protein